MLLFRRKTGKDVYETVGSRNTSPAKSSSSSSSSIINGDLADYLQQDKGVNLLREYEGASFVTLSNRRRRSRLMPNLDEILNDKKARQHFLNFLQTKGAAHLIEFWTEAESFEMIASARLASYNIHSMCSKCTGHSLENSSTSEANACICNSMVTSQKSRIGDSVIEDRPTLQELCDKRNIEEVPNGRLLSDNLKSSQNNNKQLAEKLRKQIEDDAVMIFARHIAKDASSPIGIPDDLRDDVTRKICSESGDVDSLCFQPARNFVMHLLNRKYFQDFLHSVHNCRHQVDILTCGEVSLADVLYNESSLFYFMEFMKLEGQRDLLEFWLAADNFYQHLIDKGGKYDGIEAQEDAMILYDRYFSLQATCPLGFSDSMRLEVEQNICREEGPLPICFERAIVIVLTVFEKVYFKQFLESQLYLKYLGELVNTVQSCDEFYGQRKRSESDTCSESSLPVVNTLLAMDGSCPGTTARRIVQKFVDNDMRIDTGQFNPDALWQRQYAGKLRIGYVNDMGQFITDLEPEPDKRRTAESIISKAVRKLVYKEQDKAQQEMALQVARMIIQEVTNITMQNRLNVTLS